MPSQTANLSLLTTTQRISEGARSLIRVLYNGRLHESPRTLRLRRTIISITEKLIARCDSSETTDATSLLELHNALRRITSAITEPATEPAGVRLMLSAMAEKLMPETDFVLDSRSAPSFAFNEMMHPLQQYAKEALDTEDIASSEYFFKIFCPKGEQDNVLAGYYLVRAFLPESDSKGQPAWSFLSEAQAAWVLGPAYLFALTLSPRSLVHLCFVTEELDAVGWSQHPIVGGLLLALREQFHLSDTYLEQKLQEDANSRALIEQARAQRTHLQATLPGYTPEDFDREVPLLWERLRQLLPPNEIETGTLETAQLPEVVSIMNAGWTFYLLHIHELYRTLSATTEDDRYEARQALNRLLIKGIELSEIARRWRNATNKEN